MKNFFNQFINLRLVTSATLGLLLFWTPIAIATFAPIKRQPASDRSRTAGSRGCPGESIPLTLLAPQTYVAYTSSLRPIFVGFVSSPQKIELRIAEFISHNKLKQIGVPIAQDVAPGIFQISLPEKHPSLTVGKKYLWQIAISCPLGNIVERAEFIVLETPSPLKSQLSTITDSQQKANIYAKADLWYDALAEALKSANHGKLGKIGSSLVQDFAKLESATPKEEELVKQRVEYLQKIAIQERD